MNANEMQLLPGYRFVKASRRFRPAGGLSDLSEGIRGLSLGFQPQEQPPNATALKGRKICYRWLVRSTSTLEAIILPPLQGGTPILSVPGVKTPG
jgi:hypothetical protein